MLFKSTYRTVAAAITWVFLAPSASMADEILAPTGTLRAVYLSGNPVHAVRDLSSGEITGVAADISREMARLSEVPLDLQGVDGIDPIIDAVAEGRADIGFLAPNPSREGRVVFSQVYLRNPQSVVVPVDSPIESLEDLETGEFRIGATRNDSIAHFLRRNYQNIELVEIDGASADVAIEALRSGQVDGFAASNTRLRAIAARASDMNHLEGSITGVPQAIVVSADDPAALEAVNSFIEKVRDSGQLQEWIARADNGTVVEPAPRNAP